MSTGTLTRSINETFTLTHAKYLCSKVAADMHRCKQNYGRPFDSEIDNYATELAILLNKGYVRTYEFGYKRDEKRVVSWFYTVDSSGNLVADDSPGRVTSGANIQGAVFFNFLSYSLTWLLLTDSERDAIEATLPISRTTGSPPTDGDGYWATDRMYSAAGTTLVRKQFIPR